jgi:hypothetical protein
MVSMVLRSIIEYIPGIAGADIELPPDFKPVPQDGEVEEFYLMPIDKVAHIVQVCAHTYAVKQASWRLSHGGCHQGAHLTNNMVWLRAQTPACTDHH